MRPSFIALACCPLLARAQRGPLPEVGLGSLTSGGQFYKDKLLPQLGADSGQYYMGFLGQEAGLDQPGGPWQDQPVGAYQDQPGGPWQDQPGGPWQDQAGGPYQDYQDQPGGPWQDQPGGPWQDQLVPCSPEPPVFPAVYSCEQCAWMYQQELPCWQEYDPCLEYYHCQSAQPTHPQPAPTTTTTSTTTTTTPAGPPQPQLGKNCTKPIEFSIGDQSYHLSSPMADLSWPRADAKAGALGEGWGLASPGTEGLLGLLALAADMRDCRLGPTVWVGGNSLAEPGRWVWADGAAVAGDLWGEAPGPGEECMMLAGPSPRWRAHSCLNPGVGRHAFLAQKGSGPTTTTTTEPTTTQAAGETTPGRPAPPTTMTSGQWSLTTKGGPPTVVER